jgi:hypothetical protein
MLDSLVRVSRRVGSFHFVNVPNGVGLAAIPHGTGYHLARRAAQRVVDPELGYASTVSSSLRQKVALPQAPPSLDVVALKVPGRLSSHDLGRGTA